MKNCSLGVQQRESVGDKKLCAREFSPGVQKEKNAPAGFLFPTEPELFPAYQALQNRSDPVWCLKRAEIEQYHWLLRHQIYRLLYAKPVPTAE